MGNTPATLISLAEVAVALAGFAAIVVVLKRGTQGRWRRVDADRFHGMILHAIVAVVFCLLPSIVNVFVQDTVTTLKVVAAVLGVQILVHAGIVVAGLSSRGKVAIAAMAVGLVVGLLQFTVFTAWAVHRQLDIYVLGIIWHILQAGTLFVLLVWVDEAEVEPSADDEQTGA